MECFIVSLLTFQLTFTHLGLLQQWHCLKNEKQSFNKEQKKFLLFLEAEKRVFIDWEAEKQKKLSEIVASETFVRCCFKKHKKNFDFKIFSFLFKWKLKT